MLGAATAPLQPFVQAGTTAVEALGGGLERFMNDPAFQFRLAEGQKAIERSAAARGGLVSGRTLKDVTRFSQGLASEEFGQAFNRALATSQLGLGAAGRVAGLTRDIGGDITRGLLQLGTTGAGVSREVGDILAGSALGSSGAIAARERLLGQIKANKRAAQMTLGERVSQGVDPFIGAGLGLISAVRGGGPGTIGQPRNRRRQDPQAEPASFGGFVGFGDLL